MSHDAGDPIDIRAPGVRVRIDGATVEVAVGQAELDALADQERIEEPVIVGRVERRLQGGGFGDPEAHPHTWGVFLRIDGRMARVTSARGAPREWTSLDRLEPWLRGQGFRRWQVINDLDPPAG